MEKGFHNVSFSLTLCTKLWQWHHQHFIVLILWCWSEALFCFGNGSIIHVEISNEQSRLDEKSKKIVILFLFEDHIMCRLYGTEV